MVSNGAAPVAMSADCSHDREMAVIEYFYSAHSAYAYLGSARFMQIAAAAGRRIAHKPMDLRRVVAVTGPGPFGDRSKAHVAYYFGRQIERWADYRKAPVMDGTPTHHGKDMTLCNGMLIAALHQDLVIDQLAHALLQAHWRDDADLADREILAQIARDTGYEPAPLLDAALAPETLAIYESNTEEAIRRSVFGSPTYFVDGDMFYGQDHLDLVEAALSKPFAGTWPRAEAGR